MKIERMIQHKDGTQTVFVSLPENISSLNVGLANGATVDLTQYANMGEKHEPFYSVAMFDHDGTRPEVTRYNMDKENDRSEELRKWQE